MVWNYDGDPENSLRDAVRLLVGDTDASDQLVDDGEIQFALSLQNENIYRAAAEVADMLSARFSRSVSLSVEGLSAQFERRSIAFAELAVRLRKQARTRRGKVVSRLDEQFLREPANIDVGMHDNPQPSKESLGRKL